MESIQLTLHIISGFLFLSALWAHVFGFLEVRKCRAAKLVKYTGYGVMTWGACLTCLFIVLQFDWVIKGHNANVGESTSWAWLLFDYFLGVYLFTNATLVRVFSEWKGGYKSPAD